jgi:mannose-6-phosphate isomerase-like protein (cupin superfamily)
MKANAMKSPILAAALLFLAAPPAAAQRTNGVIVVSAEQVEQIRQKARAAQAASGPARPSVSQPIILAQPYMLNLEYRTGKAPASQHPAEAELMMVMDGAGTVTTGGALVNATAANGNISGSDIADGTSRHVVKDDMLIVPQGVPHMMVPDAGGVLVLATLHLPRTGEPAPVPGRAPAAPKLVTLAADLPAMIKKAKAAVATSPRFFGGDTLLSLPPYRLGLEYRSPKAIASVHKNDGEFMFVLEGEGVIVAGGTVVNPKDLGANIDGEAIQGGDEIRMKKGDFIFVPKGVPHLAKSDGAFMLATLHVPQP